MSAYCGAACNMLAMGGVEPRERKGAESNALAIAGVEGWRSLRANAIEDPGGRSVACSER